MNQPRESSVTCYNYALQCLKYGPLQVKGYGQNPRANVTGFTITDLNGHI